MPKKPEMNPDASDLWDLVVDWLMEHGQVQSLDAVSLELMCRLWALTRESLAAAEVEPLDKDIRIAATTYAQRFESLASRFGLSPVDRARLNLKVANEPKKDDKARFFRTVG